MTRLYKTFLNQAAGSSLTGGGFSDYLKFPSAGGSSITRIGIIIVIIIVIAVALYYGYKYLSKKFSVGYKANSEHIPVDGVSGNECELLLFTANWCPICKRAAPEWEQVKLEYKGKTVNGYTIVFTDVDCTNESPNVTKLMDQYKIEGFPTIKLIKNGQVVEFDAKVTKANLEQFINTAI
jgi:thiol-disulfide isomerase/thioredoxin